MTGNERHLTEVAINQQLWAEATDELFKEDLDTREQADYYGLAFADAVAAGELDAQELKAMATEANQLDKEAVEQAGGDIEKLPNTADYFEAMARRIAHQSLRYAHDLVKHGSHLRRPARGRMPGLGSDPPRPDYMLE